MRVAVGRRPPNPADYLPQVLAAVTLVAGAGCAVAFDAPGPALMLLAGLMPVLLFSLLAEVDRWSDQGIFPLLMTFAGGCVLGLCWGAVIVFGSVPGPIAAVAVVALPTALAVAAISFISHIGRFDEALDGYAFGAANVFGWYIGFQLLVTGTAIYQGVFDVVSATSWLWLMVPDLFLRPAAVTAAVGVISAALWIGRGRALAPTSLRWVLLEIACLIAVAGIGFLDWDAALTAVALGVVAGVATLGARYSIRGFLLQSGSGDR